MNGIVMRPFVEGGPPIPSIESTNVDTRTVLDLFMNGTPITKIAEVYRLTEHQVEQAIRFECCLACDCETCAWARELTRAFPERGQCPLCKLEGPGAVFDGKWVPRRGQQWHALSCPYRDTHLKPKRSR